MYRVPHRKAGCVNMKQVQNSGERLARFLAHAGIASRRHAEELIASGRVQVNGVIVTTQGTRINPDTDTVFVDGKPVHSTSKHVYVLLHKPIGYVTTSHDPQGRPTVLDLLPAELRALRVYSVGRLDIDSSGLLLLTNDGDFALHLTHPRYSMQKHYQALVQGCPSESSLAALRSGVTITEDKGRSHKTTSAQVRRMLAAVGHPVLELSRVGIGLLELGDLPEGKWRYLTGEEVKALQGYTQTS